MTDERRWTIRRWFDGLTIVDGPPTGPSEDGEPVVVVPASSVVPISRLRQFVESERLYDDTGTAEDVAHMELLDRLAALLDGLECASNPNNEGTSDA